ncbi:MAG: IS630 family transposase [Polyangia bacterium]
MEKKRALQTRLAELDPATGLWAQDETDIRLFPPLRKSWSRRGQQAAVDLHGRNQKQVLFGGLNLRTAERVLLPRRRQTAADFAQWLLLLRQRAGEQPLCVLLDENSCHKAAASRVLAAQLGIELLFLPTRSPHLNPADHLWRAAKQHVCANRQDQTLDSLMQAVVYYLAQLSPEQVLRKAGVLSRRFWLRRAVLR